MNDKGDVVMDENVHNPVQDQEDVQDQEKAHDQDGVENMVNPEETVSGKDNKGSGGDPWGCGTIMVMLVVGLCVNMCSVLKEIRNDSYDYTPHHYNNSSDWSHWSAAFSKKDTTVNDSTIVDSVIPAYNVVAE